MRVSAVLLIYLSTSVGHEELNDGFSGLTYCPSFFRPRGLRLQLRNTLVQDAALADRLSASITPSFRIVSSRQNRGLQYAFDTWTTSVRSCGRLLQGYHDSLFVFNLTSCITVTLTSFITVTLTSCITVTLTLVHFVHRFFIPELHNAVHGACTFSTN